MKKYLVVLFLFLSLIPSSDAKQLSKQSKVYLMVVGPYFQDFASIWGHVALWVKDDVNEIDVIYNYGGAAYGGNFMLKLVSGKLKFFLDTHQTLAQDLKTYERAKRDVDLYELNLDYNERNKLFSYLENNAKEENKYYSYEFYLKNCATFTFDAIKKSINGEIVYANNSTDITYREICDGKFKYFPWTDFFIKLVAGKKNDDKLDLEGIFFVPTNMVDNLKTAKINSKNNSKSFFKSHKVIYDFPDNVYVHSFVNSPIFPIGILFVLEIILFSISFIKKKVFFKYYDYFWFIIASLLSIFVLFTMVFTHYIVTKSNFNILWVNPLFIFTFFIKGEKKEKLFKLISVLLVVFILGYFIFPQTLYLVNLLLAGILLLKTLKYGFLKSKFEN